MVSAWGPVVETWRTTANGLEAVATRHCDAGFGIDEIGQLSAREAGMVMYMLANEVGKTRMKRDISIRPPPRWRTIFLSTGELGMSDKVSEDGRSVPTAGQMVRVVDVPADAGRGLGIFEDLHGSASPQAFADRLRVAAGHHCGHAARLFVGRLRPDRESSIAIVRMFQEYFVREFSPGGADGQVARVASRFALVAAAGELARMCGILPWEKGDAIRACGACFKAWLDDRGGVGSAEAIAGFERVETFFSVHLSRFERKYKVAPIEVSTGKIIYPQEVHNCAGWYDDTEFYVIPETFRTEIAKGMDSKELAKLLVEAKWIVPGSDGKSTQSVYIRGVRGTRRVYVFSREAIFGKDAKEESHTDEHYFVD
jgi:uncharacterized protein (DUF927 family)